LRIKELNKSKDLKFNDNGEDLSVSRGRGESRGNHGKSNGGDKSKYKCFNCHKINHFKRDYLELGDDGDYVKFVVALEDY